MEAPHWINRVMDCVSSDPGWWDGLLLGFAVAVLIAVPLFWWLQ